MVAQYTYRMASNVNHIEEIREAGLEIPAANQIEVRTRLYLVGSKLV